MSIPILRMCFYGGAQEDRDMLYHKIKEILENVWPHVMHNNVDILPAEFHEQLVWCQQAIHEVLGLEFNEQDEELVEFLYEKYKKKLHHSFAGKMTFYNENSHAISTMNDIVFINTDMDSTTLDCIYDQGFHFVKIKSDKPDGIVHNPDFEIDINSDENIQEMLKQLMDDIKQKLEVK